MKLRHPSHRNRICDIDYYAKHPQIIVRRGHLTLMVSANTFKDEGFAALAAALRRLGWEPTDEKAVITCDCIKCWKHKKAARAAKELWT